MSRGNAWLRKIGYDPIIVRGAIAGTLALCYYQLDWRWLRLVLRFCTATFLSWLGHEVRPVPSLQDIVLLVDRVAFSFSPNCTYAVLILLVSPFVWRLHLRWTQNVMRVAVLAIMIEGLNVVRVALSIHLARQGVSWNLVHDVPHTVLHYAVLATAIFFAIRADHKHRAECPDLSDESDRLIHAENR
ncbi:MAG TPA: hypothetical protein VN577_01175 [Terriglobales bacterium]|nr:hypothetical protein [Terriglobales bacterium]